MAKPQMRVGRSRVPIKRRRLLEPESVATLMTPCSRNCPRPSPAQSQEPSVSEETNSWPLEASEGDDLGVQDDGGLDVQNDGSPDCRDAAGLDAQDDDDLVNPYDDPLDDPSDDEEDAMTTNTKQRDPDARASASRHASKEQRRLAAFAKYLYPCVRALCFFKNPVSVDRPCDVYGCNASAAFGHKVVQGTTKSTVKNVKNVECCEGSLTKSYFVRLHTFDIDADKIFVKTCADHHIARLAKPSRMILLS
ncbi:hypothetical protein SPRG_03876 [Saprolegnia parasitica CBS 223.65]|uniref:Uncharacterized protein n=1 Tax=Saprolegnia parasitica (strain CBS 223.65) TaxID=695850 RepID=A0A067CPV3_SAPPC|nr:hypothetical protein SPRG_03876 [Saprolegnia parasitica CBS 223.65]KDO31260.1 hypothetical protein SPRG_03876 [Saprolegnia parasitica CBS 223.65]|eukprot:XP_012197861.1 hypothetical protein SPRG_03876 [Saprolegnia parasitica CBS 223.65]